MIYSESSYKFLIKIALKRYSLTVLVIQSNIVNFNLYIELLLAEIIIFSFILITFNDSRFMSLL